MKYKDSRLRINVVAHITVVFIIRIRIFIYVSTSHSDSFSSISCATFVLYDSSSCGNREARLSVSFGGITSISGYMSLNWSSTGSLLSPSSTASKMPDFFHPLVMTALPSGLLMNHRRISATLHAGASRHLRR